MIRFRGVTRSGWGDIAVVSVLATLGMAATGPAPVAGQATEAAATTPRAEQPWLARWRPLEVLGDLPRTLPGSESPFPALLAFPAPRVGTLWTVGNPAALPFELEDRRTDFSISREARSGRYRRPLDPTEVTNVTLTGSGWRPLSERAAVIGRLVVQRTGLGDGSFSDQLMPYATSPFAVFDTTGEAQTRTLVRVEGASGWRFGRLALGLALGYESQRTFTDDARVPRLNRTATPGATVGLAWVSSSGGLTIGVLGGLQETAQTSTIYSRAAASRAYTPEGYGPLVAFDLLAAGLRRRFERDAKGLTVSASGRAGAVKWVVYGRREALTESRFTTFIFRELADDWDTRGWTLGGAGSLSSGSLDLALDARFTTLVGRGFRGDLDLEHFESTDRRLRIEADGRWKPVGGWEAGARLILTRNTSDRWDRLSRTGSEFSSWSPALGIELARRLSGHVAVSLGSVVSTYGVSSTTPPPGQFGSAWEKWIAPELGLMATGATGWAAQATLLIGSNDSRTVWLRAQYGRGQPATPAELQSDTPTGSRDRFELTIGVVLPRHP
ncbi:DUF6850 family outer membrane beta-barrel protein [Candidatus Palauibacter sp.]|uniref:DUF6850 family outer membrane beta-barrel protein n=1 Tax=Candidatus Palauibacter sp. TaxID=3101350 RepID=UPI003AF2CB53